MSNRCLRSDRESRFWFLACLEALQWQSNAIKPQSRCHSWLSLEPRPSSPRFYLAADFSPRLRDKIWARKAWVRGYSWLRAPLLTVQTYPESTSRESCSFLFCRFNIFSSTVPLQTNLCMRGRSSQASEIPLQHEQNLKSESLQNTCINVAAIGFLLRVPPQSSLMFSTCTHTS